MAILSYSLSWNKNPNFGLKNTNVIRNMLTIQDIFRFYKSSSRVLVVCQKLAVKHYPIKS